MWRNGPPALPSAPTGSDAWSIYMWEFRKIRGSFKGILKRSLKGSIRGSIRGFRFPNIRGTLFGGPYNKDPTIWGTI